MIYHPFLPEGGGAGPKPEFYFDKLISQPEGMGSLNLFTELQS